MTQNQNTPNAQEAQEIQEAKTQETQAQNTQNLSTPNENAQYNDAQNKQGFFAMLGSNVVFIAFILAIFVSLALRADNTDDVFPPFFYLLWLVLWFAGYSELFGIAITKKLVINEAIAKKSSILHWFGRRRFITRTICFCLAGLFSLSLSFMLSFPFVHKVELAFFPLCIILGILVVKPFFETFLASQINEKLVPYYAKNVSAVALAIIGTIFVICFYHSATSQPTLIAQFDALQVQYGIANLSGGLREIFDIVIAKMAFIEYYASSQNAKMLIFVEDKPIEGIYIWVVRLIFGIGVFTAFFIFALLSLRVNKATLRIDFDTNPKKSYFKITLLLIIILGYAISSSDSPNHTPNEQQDGQQKQAYASRARETLQSISALSVEIEGKQEFVSFTQYAKYENARQEYLSKIDELPNKLEQTIQSKTAELQTKLDKKTLEVLGEYLGGVKQEEFVKSYADWYFSWGGSGVRLIGDTKNAVISIKNAVKSFFGKELTQKEKNKVDEASSKFYEDFKAQFPFGKDFESLLENALKGVYDEGIADMNNELNAIWQDSQNGAKKLLVEYDALKASILPVSNTDNAKLESSQKTNSIDMLFVDEASYIASKSSEFVKMLELDGVRAPEIVSGGVAVGLLGSAALRMAEAKIGTAIAKGVAKQAGKLTGRATVCGGLAVATAGVGGILCGATLVVGTEVIGHFWDKAQNQKPFEDRLNANLNQFKAGIAQDIANQNAKMISKLKENLSSSTKKITQMPKIPESSEQSAQEVQHSTESSKQNQEASIQPNEIPNEDSSALESSKDSNADFVAESSADSSVQPNATNAQ